MSTYLPRPNVHWVKPLLPTTLGDLESINISGTDQIFAAPDWTWIYPGPLDIETLKTALSQALSNYPHAAGRLICDSQTRKWRIKLTNEGVPITVGTTNLSYAPDEWFYSHERHPDLIDPMPMSFHPLELRNEPLLRFKLVDWKQTGETSLSVAFCHLLGDASTLFCIMATISNYYQGLPAPMIPTFEKYLNPEPTIERQFVFDTLAQIPHLGVDYTAEKFYQMYSEMLSTTSRVDFKVTLAELTAIRDLANKSAGQRVSTMDSILAYLVTVLNATLEIPIQTIIHVVEYRGAKSAPGSNYVPPPRTSAGNNIVTIHSKPIPADHNNSIGLIARAIREQITRAREPENLRRLVGLSDELFNRATETGRLFWWWPAEGAVGVNNMYKADMRSIHFGYQDGVRIYMHDAWERYFLVCPANPVKLPDGTWKTYDGGADICFRIKHGRRDDVLRAFREGLKRLTANADGQNPCGLRLGFKL